MTFEEWMKRPVYVAQCKTARMATKLGIFCVRFRCLPAHRDLAARQARRLVTQAMRLERKHSPEALPEATRAQWLWAYEGPLGAHCGSLIAVDARDALSRVMTSDHHGQLFGPFHGVPVDILALAPGNADRRYTDRGEWGSIDMVAASEILNSVPDGICRATSEDLASLMPRLPG